jgi:Asp-tRNA(Asn)/Glu-tRNA(Gln) amidotransferase A subunit family amidase
VTGDAPSIAELKSTGALLVGKANLHEIGVGMTGLNTIHGTTRNPYNTAAYTGGSSSGSAAIVSSGLCAFALGVLSQLLRWLGSLTPHMSVSLCCGVER